MDGAGQRSQWTMIAFMWAAMSMIGVHPQPDLYRNGIWGVRCFGRWKATGLFGVLVIKQPVKRALFLPILYAAGLSPQAGPGLPEQPRRLVGNHIGCCCCHRYYEACFATLSGVFAGSPLAPLSWAS